MPWLYYFYAPGKFIGIVGLLFFMPINSLYRIASCPGIKYRISIRRVHEEGRFAIPMSMSTAGRPFIT